MSETTANITTGGTIHVGTLVSGTKWMAECGTSPRSRMRPTQAPVSCSKCLKLGR